jgi:hypothetical protein
MSAGEPQDDPSTPDSAHLWRRIPPWYLVWDDNRGAIRISSAAFDNDRDGSTTSIVLGELVLSQGRLPP